MIGSMNQVMMKCSKDHSNVVNSMVSLPVSHTLVHVCLSGLTCILYITLCIHPLPIVAVPTQRGRRPYNTDGSRYGDDDTDCDTDDIHVVEGGRFATSMAAFKGSFRSMLGEC
jgi:hypothetical protein